MRSALRGSPCVTGGLQVLALLDCRDRAGPSCLSSVTGPSKICNGTSVAQDVERHRKLSGNYGMENCRSGAEQRHWAGQMAVRSVSTELHLLTPDLGDVAWHLARAPTTARRATRLDDS